MKLSKTTREQVADLLRCAADLCSDNAERTDEQPFTSTAQALDVDSHIRNLAARAWNQAWSDATRRGAYQVNGVTSFRLTLLEAAACVEEGSLPRMLRRTIDRRMEVRA